MYISYKILHGLLQIPYLVIHVSKVTSQGTFNQASQQLAPKNHKGPKVLFAKIKAKLKVQ